MIVWSQYQKCVHSAEQQKSVLTCCFHSVSLLLKITFYFDFDIDFYENFLSVYLSVIILISFYQSLRFHLMWNNLNEKLEQIHWKLWFLTHILCSSQGWQILLHAYCWSITDCDFTSQHVRIKLHREIFTLWK